MAFLDNTGVTRLVTDLKARFAAITHNHAASDITSGTLPIARGGTGVTANPSMLTNLESTVADTVFEATPRPGVTGTLAVANGGTGKATHTSNALLAGDGTSAVKNVATADGALYATAANGAAQFGTLPIAQGGTAGTTKTEARTSLEVPVNSSIATVEYTTATANHAEGDYFMLGDTLMCATTAIATGETISTSNATPATVQSQIDTLRDSVAYRGDGAMNLNDVKVPGLYYAYNASSNLPTSGVGGMLMVSSGGGGALVHQLFLDNNFRIRARTCSGGSWAAWDVLKVS